MSDQYHKLQDISKYYNEHNDCTVKAVAIASGLSYERSHNLLRQWGRKPQQGFNMTLTIKALESVGFETRLIQHYPRKKDRMETIANNNIPSIGTYIVETSSHTLAIVDGEVEDWTNGRGHKIIRVWLVVPSRCNYSNGYDLDHPIPVLGQRRTRKETYKWKVMFGDEVISRYKRRPRWADRANSRWVRGRKNETYGKLTVEKI